MAKDNEVELGEIVLFHAEEEGRNRPFMEGKMKTPKGTYFIKLWKEANPKVTKGELLSGYVYSLKKEGGQ